jgi:mono/diheme cytochrome c family protein
MKLPRCAFLLAFCISYAGATRAGEGAIQLDDAPGRELTVARCAVCHSLDYIQMNSAVMNRTAWEKSVRKMIERFGAPISEEDAKTILDYLTTHYSPSSATPQPQH